MKALEDYQFLGAATGDAVIVTGVPLSLPESADGVLRDSALELQLGPDTYRLDGFPVRLLEGREEVLLGVCNSSGQVLSGCAIRLRR